MRARCVEERVIRLNTASESVESEARAKQLKLRSGPGIRLIEATVPCANQRVPLPSSGHHCHVTLGLKGDLRFGLASLPLARAMSYQFADKSALQAAITMFNSPATRAQAITLYGIPNS